MFKNIQIKSTVVTHILIWYAKLKACILVHAITVSLTWLQWIKYLCGAAKLCFISFTLSSECTYVNQSLVELQNYKSKISIHNSLHLDYVDSLLWTNITTANLYFILLGFLLPPKNCEAVSVRSQILHLKAENTPFYCALLP